MKTVVRPVLVYGLECVYQTKTALHKAELSQAKLFKSSRKIEIADIVFFILRNPYEQSRSVINALLSSFFGNVFWSIFEKYRDPGRGLLGAGSRP